MRANFIKYNQIKCSSVLAIRTMKPSSRGAGSAYDKIDLQQFYSNKEAAEADRNMWQNWI